MHRLVTIILMVTTPFVSGDDEVDIFISTLESLNNNYYSSEAKEVAEKVGEFMANLLEGLEDILEEVKTQNCVSDSLKNFNAAISTAKTCAIDMPKGYDNAEDTIASAADACAFSVSVDDLLTVLQELGKIEKQIQDLDAKLQANPSQVDKTKIIIELKNVFSAQVVTELKKLVVLDIKKSLDKCIKDSTKDLFNDLESCTKKIKECMAKST